MMEDLKKILTTTTDKIQRFTYSRVSFKIF